MCIGKLTKHFLVEVCKFVIESRNKQRTTGKAAVAPRDSKQPVEHRTIAKAYSVVRASQDRGVINRQGVPFWQGLGARTITLSRNTDFTLVCDYAPTPTPNRLNATLNFLATFAQSTSLGKEKEKCLFTQF